ncbi:MAG: hypothetical protein JXR50_02120 [Prolixibacteraceae bacterium]|nr:hypothetical protein [Prolixibacteraceae bacterium]MBN2648514.1 hypothetical protein [Prolixibacteraceae bacterium]
MTLLKKKIVFIGMFCALAIGAGAQSTPTHPYEGATHTYVLNGLTPGVEYDFFMTLRADGSGVLDPNSENEFDFLTCPNGKVEAGESTAKLPVKWRYGASYRAYYLWVTLTPPNGCSNSRCLEILPQPNAFDLLSENIPVDNTESCPAIAKADGFNPLADEYDAGTTTLKFKIRREGGNKAWTFEPKVFIEPNWNVDVSIVHIVAANAGLIEAGEANRYTVPASDDEVIVTVAVRNYEGTEQIVTMAVRNQQEESTQLGDSNSENDQVRHRITVMPIISDLEEI